VIFIAAVWAIGAYFIWKYGPGLRTRSVWCPVFKKRARILAVQREARFWDSYAGLSIANVKRCSLLDMGAGSCHRECIRPRAQSAHAS
jgi:hypothetical protein